MSSLKSRGFFSEAWSLGSAVLLAAEEGGHACVTALARAVIDQHNEAAKASGARIVFSAGFDSIPFDLGVLMLQKHCVETFGAPAPRVKGRVRAMKGTFSGGTAASLKATMAAASKDPAVIGYLTNPFSLAGGFQGPAQPAGHRAGQDARQVQHAQAFKRK